MNRHVTRIGLRTSLLILLLSMGYTSRAQDRFQIEHLNRLVNLSDLKISPDGNKALFMTARRNMDKNNFDRALVVLHLSTKEQQVVGTDLKTSAQPDRINSLVPYATMASKRNSSPSPDQIISLLTQCVRWMYIKSGLAGLKHI